jgi:hypothetical protein
VMGHHEPAGGNTEVTVPEGLICHRTSWLWRGRQPGGIAVDLGCNDGSRGKNSMRRILEAAATAARWRRRRTIRPERGHEEQFPKVTHTEDYPGDIKTQFLVVP